MAYTYTGTPSDQIEAAKRRISGNNAVAETALSSYMAMAEAAQNEFTGVQEEKKEEVSAFQRAAETFGDVVRNIFIGVGKAIEGVVDFGASTVGVIAGWAGNEELKQQVSDWTAKDITTGISNSWIEHLNTNYGIDVSFSHSFVNDMSERGQRIVRGVSQGIGQMLPLVLLTVATAGAGAAAAGASAGASAAGTATTATQATVAGLKAAKTIQTAGKIANMALLGMSAAGNATEEALNAEVYNEDGTKRKVSLDRAYLYGLASGAVEVATEMFVGGGFEKVFGGGIADKMISKLAKSTRFEKAVKFAMNAVGEGVEEVAAEAVSNTLKTIYNSKDGKVHWEDSDVQAMFESGVIGTLTAAVMQGGDVAVRKISNTMTVADTVVDLDNIERKLENMSSAETLDTETQTNLQAEYNKNLETLTKRFNQASEKQQKKMLATNPSLSKFINEDGTLRHSVQLNEGVAEITREQANSPAMSQSLFNRTNEVANSLAEHNTTIAENFDGVQTENVRKLRTVLKKAGINNGTALKVVVAENLVDRNAYIRDDMFVISKDRLSSIQDMAKDLAHETTHFAEGTKEYGKLVDFLQASLLGKKGTKQYTFTDGSTFKTATLWEQAVMEVWENSTASGRENGYKITQETFDKILKGDTDANTAEARLAISEIVAKASEYVLGDEKIVNNLVEKDRSTAKAWLRKIKDTAKYIEAAFKGDKAVTETIKELRRAEKMFEDALAASGEKYLRGKVAENALSQIRRQSDTQYSMAGERAKIANISQLERAINMEKDGISSEEIRQTTGWFRGFDKKWRFEIDDSTFAMIENPNLTQHSDNGEKWYTGKLFDIIKHEKLFAAYPELKEYLVIIQETNFGTEGIFFPKDKQIVLSMKLFTRLTNEYKDLLNNRGKYIKEIEATPEYKEYNSFYENVDENVDSIKWLEEEERVRNKFFSSELGKRYYELQWGRTSANIKTTELGWNNRAREVIIHEVQHAVQEIEGFASGTKPGRTLQESEVYDRNAGEIEARDTSRRLDYSEEERRQTRPDIDRDNVVFADRSRDQSSVRFTGEKHYTKEEARKIINSIVDMRLVLNENTFGDLTNKTKKQVIDALWRGLNETPKGQQIKTALEVADYIIDNAIYDDQYNNGGVREEDLRTVELLKPHLHSLNLKGIRAEIKHYFDRKNSVYLLWSAKEGGISPDQLAMELSERGFQFTSNNEADQFIQIVEAYSEAVNRLKGNAQELFSKYMSKEQRNELRQKIARDVLLAFDNNGTPTVLANKLKKYEREISNLRKMVAEGRTYNNALNRVLDLANDLKLENIKKYHNSSILDDKVFTKIISGLGKIKYRSDLRKPTTRAILGAFSTWYNIDNELLNGGLDTDTAKKTLAADNAVGYINGDILFALEYFKSDADNKKPLELVELRAAEAILEHAKFILKNYDKVTLSSRQTTLSETAQSATSIASKFSSMHKHTKMREVLRTYGYNIVEPRVVFESMFGYEDNGLVQAFNDVCAGETESGRIRLELILTIDNFMKEHKKYKKRLASDKIYISGHEISIGTALSLYMLAKQQASIDGLRKGGWGFRDSNGYYVDCGCLTDSDIATIENSLSETDKAFLKVAREFFNKGGEYMKATDKKIKGYSLISTENSDYFPIVRYSGDIAKSVEQNYLQAMSNASVQNMGITKQRVKNNKRIEVYDILSVMETHAKQIGQYSGLAIPIKAFQQIYNCRLDGNTSLRNVLNEKTWKGFDKYVTNWLADVQGMGKIHTKIDSAIDALRGAYAKYQLGANIKVIFSQLASYPTAFYYLSTASMTKAFGHAFSLRNTDATPFKLMDKYCPWAKVRNANKGIALAEGNLERLGQVGDFFTKPIQWADRLTIGLLWNACQCEVERLHKGDVSFKYGTEANMVEAGRLLEKVGRGTQPNYTASERSALQRSNSQVAKTFSMFSSVPLKQISRLFEAFGRERALRYKKNVLKENASADELKAAHKATARALTAVTVANIVYVLMGELIKTALKKDREDKEGNEISIMEDLFRDFLSTSVGMLPIIKDVYNVLFQQYENTDFVSSGFNELFGSVRDIYDMVAMLGSGEPYEASDIAKPLRSFCYALGQVTGIPTRNIYNLIFGLTKRFDESKAYEWNSIFYSQNYTKDLKQAIESGESDKATTIIGLMLKDDGMTSTSPKVNEKLRTLYASGYAVLPRSVSDKIIYDGEVIALSQKSQNAFKGVYSEANKEVETLIKSKAFDGLNEEVQAKAIKWIYDYYYESAVYATVGEEANSKKQLFGETMSVSKFAMVVSACSMVEAKTDKKGNVINGSKRAAILKLLNSLSLSSGEKIMILAYLGYSVDEYAMAIKRYVANIGLSKTQQKALIGYCLK